MLIFIDNASKINYAGLILCYHIVPFKSTGTRVIKTFSRQKQKPKTKKQKKRNTKTKTKTTTQNQNQNKIKKPDEIQSMHPVLWPYFFSVRR